MFLRKQDKTAVWCGDRYFIWTKYPGVLLRPQLLLGVSRSLFLQCRSMCIHMGGKIKKKPAKWNRWQIQLFYSPLNIYSVKRPRATSKIQKNKTKQQDTHTKKNQAKECTVCLPRMLKLLQALSEGGRTHWFFEPGWWGGRGKVDTIPYTQ